VVTPLRVGLVGAGRWAALHHLPGLAEHPAAELVAVHDPDVSRRDEVVRRFGGIAASGLDEVLEAVEAVIVASPPAAHHAAAAAALDRGLHVLVEKPMTIDAADAWDLVSRADEAGVVLMVGYTFELTSTADRVVDAVEGLGDLVLVDGVYASSMRHLFNGRWPLDASDPLAVPHPETFADPVISGGGQARGQLTHLLAAALRAAAVEPRSATAMFRPEGAALELHVALTVDLGGTLATFASTCALPPGHPPLWEVRYVGERGTVIHDLAAGAAVVRIEGRDQASVPALPAEERYPSRAVAQRFVDVVFGRAENPAPGRLGAEVAALLEAAHHSAGRGGDACPVSRPVSGR
jgi:predicted dehydrogenase